MNPKWKLSVLFLPPALAPLWPRPQGKNSYDPALSNRRMEEGDDIRFPGG